MVRYECGCLQMAADGWVLKHIEGVSWELQDPGKGMCKSRAIEEDSFIGLQLQIK